MVNFFVELGTAFFLGLLTPLTALCVLPLYPGFLAYLSNQLAGDEKNKKLPVMFGLVVIAGVIVFMLLLGLVFTTILQFALTNVIAIISPIAFGILAIISIALIFNIDIGKYLPRVNAPVGKNPLWSAFLFGFFFGAIVIPCNPLFIAALFTRAISSVGFFVQLLNFISFGLGIGAPLLLLAVVSTTASGAIISFLGKHKRKINLVSGLIMLGVSLYYIFIVFKVFG